ncbi:MAG: hypothetical protein KC609_08395 [Myxococcales bacterium]|nr:hypothetical protein [Myxococcales bacterium]
MISGTPHPSRLARLFLVATIALSLPTGAAPRRVVLSFPFKISSNPQFLRFSVRLGRIADEDLWDKLESGVTKPILYRLQLLNGRGEVAAEFFRRLSVRYDPLAQVPFFEVKRSGETKATVAKTRPILLAMLTDFPYPFARDGSRLEEFPESLLAELDGGSYRLRIQIWLNPWTDEQLARLNKLFRPLGPLNLLRVRLFDNSKFRPQREFEITSQPFYLHPRRRHGTL